MNNLVSLSLALAAVPLLSHGATIIFSENFEGATAGSSVTASNTAFDQYVDSNTSSTATTDTGNIFGNGTSNIYNQTNDNVTGATVMRWNGLNLGDVATYSVSYRSTGTGTAFDFRMALVDDAVANRAAFVSGSDLTGFSGFSSDTTYRFHLVANNTGAALTNYYGDEDLATGRYDVFVTDLDGTFETRVMNDVAFINSEDTDNDGFDAVSFQTYWSDTGIALAWDDVVVRNDAFVGAAIPEPSAALLAGLGALALLRRRR